MVSFTETEEKRRGEELGELGAQCGTGRGEVLGASK